MGGPAMNSRMGRRMTVAAGLCAAVPLCLFALGIARTADSDEAAAAQRRLTDVAGVYADVIRSRIGAGTSIVEAATTADSGADATTVRQPALNSRAFKSVVLVNSDGILGNGATALRPSAAQRSALEAGQTVLLPATLEGQLPATFLVRSISAAGTRKLAYFEFAPDWLWQDLPSAPGTAIALVDADGHVLLSPASLSADMTHMFAEHISLSGERGGVLDSLSWQYGGEAWQGVLTHVRLTDERITAVPWAVVAYAPESSFFARSQRIWQLLPFAVLALIISALFAAQYLARAYLPTVRALRAALPALRRRYFEPLLVCGRDEHQDLIEAFNQSATSLQEQFVALETLGEIDKLLLGSAALEQVLEGILRRVQAVTGCHSVGITLRDADAPGRGRVYVAVNGMSDLPVNRVALDHDMLLTLAAETAGLTIARCEEMRHSFLRSMKEAGAEFFWVWPVNVAERLEAILAIGYQEAPLTDPHLARCGGQFAERLAVALSKSAHDEQLYRQAHFDPLTALPNRILFRDRLSQEIATATAGLSRGALLYIDLDYFKRVNDTVGHSAGDQLLTIVAQRLRACVKDGDTVARLGGDEFTVILRNVAEPAAARTIAERILESLQLPVHINNRDHFVSASIGITLFPDDASVLDAVMSNADTAMYRAKELGRGRSMFFDPQMNAAQPRATESGLHLALRRREFSLFYQPQFAIATGALSGVEALLRWQTPASGMLQPGEFVPAAEESGLIVDIGGWVLEAACAQLAVWREQKLAPPRLAVNVSVQQLRHPEFPKLVRRALERHSLSPSQIELELTESVFADAAACGALERLAQIGVHLTLDDFGTGYSSLSYLRQYPIGTVKIDRTFLQELPHNPAAATLVETIIVMAHALGKRVIAEGIESTEQLDFLRERRCDVAQGFYLARPLAGPVATELLQARALADADSREVRAAG